MQIMEFPELAAALCNNMSANGSICQGFVFFDVLHGQENCYFLGQAPNTPVPEGGTCWNSNTTTWLLDASRLLHVRIEHQAIWLWPVTDHLTAFSAYWLQHCMPQHMQQAVMLCKSLTRNGFLARTHSLDMSDCGAYG